MSGGPTVGEAASNGRALTTRDFLRIGQWISEQLKKHDIWIVLIPRDQFDGPFTYGLECSDDWRTVYIDGRQKLFVNVTHPRGSELFQGMFTGKVIYPNAYLANLAVAHNLLMSTDRNQRRRAFDLMTQVLNMQPSPSPMLETMLIAAQFPELDRRIDDVCREYVRDFEQSKDKYRDTDGCNLRLEAAELALVRLEREARVKGDMKLAKALSAQMDLYKTQQSNILQAKRW